MQADVLLRIFEELCHLGLGEPNSIAFKPDIESGLAILCFIENDLAQIILPVFYFSSLEGFAMRARLQVIPLDGQPEI